MTEFVGALVSGVATAIVVGGLIQWQEVNRDEAWLVVVTKRVRLHREALYRDIFFGVGPLPVWLLVAASRVSGIEVRTVRLLNAIFAGVLAAALWSITTAVGEPSWIRVAVVAIVALGCAPVILWTPLYQDLSKAGVAVALALAIHGRLWLAILAGGALGVAIAAKYPVGLATAPAILALLWTTSGIAGAALAAGTAVLVVAVSITPLLRHRGALRSMFIRLGPGKVSYLRHGQVPLRMMIRRDPRGLTVLSMSVLAAALAGPLALAAWAEGAPAWMFWLVAAALLAFASCTWPRADSIHLYSATPFAVLAAVVAVAGWNSVHPLPLIAVLRVLGLLWVLQLCWSSVRVAARRGALVRPSRVSDASVPGVRGLPPPLDDATIEALTIARDLADGTALVLGAAAPIAALISGIRNPTPFDYPAASTFGRHGQADIAGRIAAGEIEFVVEIDPRPLDNAPTEIEAAVDRSTAVLWGQGRVRLRSGRTPRDTR